MRRSLRRLFHADDGAVAPTVALSLFALIAAGGIAFDYARLAGMDTELQQAADQAALAGASQLDGQSGAIARATAAAQGLITNQTRMANDGAGVSVGNLTLIFYTSYNKATDTYGAVTTTDATAKIVRVTVGGREARYALTPIVGAMSSGNITAEAVAGLGTAICKTPPVMICNPTETGGNTSFDASAYIGKGIQLVSVGNGSGTWAPGNFGYLDSNSTGNGASALRESLSWWPPPGDCLGQSGVDTKPGASVSVTDALNTRFDIYNGNSVCPSPGSCPASINSVKDVVRPANASGGKSCLMDKDGWQEAASGRYEPTSPTVALPTTTTPLAMGHPRDMCHAVSVGGSCSGGRMGDGVWDRDAYFRTNYRRSGGTYWTGGTAAGSWRANTGLSASATRYEVYNWEIARRDQVIDGVTVLGPNPAGASGTTKVAYGKPVCSPVEGSPPYGPGFVPGGTIPDRRRISVAVINCAANNVNGSSDNVPVEKWVELFLVEPSLKRLSDRTNAGDVYVEVIGETPTGAAVTAGQVIRRDVPYLIR